jgi:hypothetical protein
MSKQENQSNLMRDVELRYNLIRSTRALALAIFASAIITNRGSATELTTDSGESEMWQPIARRRPYYLDKAVLEQLFATNGPATVGSAFTSYRYASAHGPPTSSVVLVNLTEVRDQYLFPPALPLGNELETRLHQLCELRV